MQTHFMKLTAKLIAVLIYILLLLYVFGFRVALLWDTKDALLVLLGTILLTFADFRRIPASPDGTGRTAISRSLCFHAIAAGCLTTFVELYARLLSQIYALDEIVTGIAMSCRPLLYGYVIFVVLRPEPVDLPPPADTSAPGGMSLSYDITGQDNNSPPKIYAAPNQDACRQNPTLPGDLLPLQNMLRGAGLTAREIEVALLVRKGFSNKEIAGQLFISDATVKKHISNIFDKLHLTNREQLRRLS